MNRFSNIQGTLLAAIQAVFTSSPVDNVHNYRHDTAYTRKEAADKVTRGSALQEAAIKRRALRNARRAYNFSRCITNNQCLRG